MGNTITTTTETQTQGSENNERKIREMVRDEIALCLKDIVTNQELMNNNQKDMAKDIGEIRTALLGGGNKYKKEKGLAEMIRVSYEYADSNIRSRVIERATPAIEMWEDWDENGNWKILAEMILNNIVKDRAKLFFGVGSFAGIMAFIGYIITLVGWLSGWFSR